MFIEKLFLYPNSIDYGGHPLVDGYKYEKISFKSYDGCKLDGWFVHSCESPAKGTLIHFHGNAANITNHWNLVKWIPLEKYNLFTFDYRGFGHSNGSANFSGIYQDCLAAISYVRTSILNRSDNLLLLGQSLGSVFCLNAAEQDMGKDLKGIIIDSGFGSFRSIANSRLTMIPSMIRSTISTSLVSDNYSPIPEIHKLVMPKLFIHGVSDRVVPFSCGEELFYAAPEPKKFLEIPNGNHLSVFRYCSRNHMKVVSNFLDFCLST